MPIDLTSDRSSTSTSTSTTFPLLQNTTRGRQGEVETLTTESFRYFGDGEDAVSLSRVYYDHSESQHYTTTTTTTTVTNNYDQSNNISFYTSFPPLPATKPSFPNRILTHRTRILTTHYLTIPATTSLLFFVGFTFLLIRETHRAISMSPPSRNLTLISKKKNMNMLTCTWNPPTKVVGLMTLYFVTAGMMACLLWATGRNGDQRKEVGARSLRLTLGDGGGDGGWVPQDLGMLSGRRRRRRRRVTVVEGGKGVSGVWRETFTGWIPQELAKPRAENGYDSPYWQGQEGYGETRESGLVARAARMRCLIPPDAYPSPSTKSRPRSREVSSWESIPVSDGTCPVSNVGIQQVTSWSGLGRGQMSEASRVMMRERHRRDK